MRIYLRNELHDFGIKADAACLSKMPNTEQRTTIAKHTHSEAKWKTCLGKREQLWAFLVENPRGQCLGCVCATDSLARP